MTENAQLQVNQVITLINSLQKGDTDLVSVDDLRYITNNLECSAVHLPAAQTSSFVILTLVRKGLIEIKAKS